MYNESSGTLLQAFGLYEAAFSATTQLLPDADSVRAPLPPPEGAHDVFEKQDETTMADCALIAPPFKRPRRSSHRTSEPKAPHLKPVKGFPPTSLPEPVLPSADQTAETSSPDEDDILTQHQSSALCVCWMSPGVLKPQAPYYMYTFLYSLCNYVRHGYCKNVLLCFLFCSFYLWVYIFKSWNCQFQSIFLSIYGISKGVFSCIH